MLRTFIIAFASTLIVGCMASYLFINKDYILDNDKHVMVLFPLMQEAVVDNDMNLFSGRFINDNRPPEIVFKDSAYINIAKVFKDSTKNVKVISLPSTIEEFQSQKDTLHFMSFTKIMGKDNLPYTFYIPKPEVIKELAGEVTIIVAINKLVFSYEEQTYGSSAPSVTGMTSKPLTIRQLTSVSHFIVYDYTKKEIISCGQIHNLDKSFKRVGINIIKNTPFWKYK